MAPLLLDLYVSQIVGPNECVLSVINFSLRVTISFFAWINAFPDSVSRRPKNIPLYQYTPAIAHNPGLLL